ncbi:MAG TPA: beta-ketoacyl synthase N-terminal-like domain-containing protein, partial [Bryobacteraceae bacterium]|nr:beta-ketoacyl synthase N-terminal-like domain-containing protein [Bryobacteraceae bacterium]
MRHRVVVTGAGVISALGHNCDEFWQELVAGRPGIRLIQTIERGLLRFPNGAEVQGFDPSKHFEEKEIGLLDRFAQFGVVAARQAIAQAGIEWNDELRANTAIVTGSCVGGQNTEDEGFVNL